MNLAKGGEVCPNEQLVWVLWKILKGDGNDVSKPFVALFLQSGTVAKPYFQIGPYSPSTLARSPLPPKLRATNLLLDDEMYNIVFDL